MANVVKRTKVAKNLYFVAEKADNYIIQYSARENGTPVNDVEVFFFIKENNDNIVTSHSHYYATLTSAKNGIKNILKKHTDLHEICFM